MEKEDILLFDRGISKADTYKQISQANKYFITRLNVGRKYIQVKENALNSNQDNSITILNDEIVNLYKQQSKRVTCDLRLVKAENKKGEELWFLTNIFYLSAQELVFSYKRRWDIEVFFKFIKQHLQFKRFISHTTNGMSVYLLYCV